MDVNILKKALIPKDQWGLCHVIDDTIYTPIFDIDGNMLKTGKQVYEDNLKTEESKTKEPIE